MYTLSIKQFPLFCNFFLIFLFCVCVCVHVHTRMCALACMSVCASHMSSAKGGQKCALSPLELELKIAVIQYEDSGI